MVSGVMFCPKISRFSVDNKTQVTYTDANLGILLSLLSQNVIWLNNANAFPVSVPPYFMVFIFSLNALSGFNASANDFWYFFLWSSVKFLFSDSNIFAINPF